MTTNNNILVPVSIGELYDKYSILLIKGSKIQDINKVTHINNELIFLKEKINKLPFFDENLFNNLLEINAQLWHIEDDIRIKEKNKDFNEEFIQLARNVYITNDKRFEIKNAINLKHNSIIFEVKSYENYT